MLLSIIQLFIAISVGLILYLLSRDKGQTEPRPIIWAAFGFGILALPIASLGEGQLGIDSIESLRTAPINHLAMVSLGVGVIEELAKFLPLALFIYKKGYFNEHTDGILYFATAGIGFGLPENILYTLGNGAGTGVVRLFLTPVFHAATTALIGYYLARTKVEKRSFAGPALALGVMILAHGLYDFGLLSGKASLALLSLGITAGLSGALFYYVTVAREDDEALGLSVVGTNRFCRQCGYPNPHKRLYCSQCGKHA
ncbi:MAG: protease PrsW [Patescibacteria group bacterium]|nr:PrsW family intramembrane metalloprotease [Candidatus Saccharibacteria bacterium]MDQ5963234.1 protease PrsW [Patescibacteria group bacterium]